jgi:hypothetical protein
LLQLHTRLDNNVRVRDTCSRQFTDGTQKEEIQTRQCLAFTGLPDILETFKGGVLDDRVDDEDEGGDDAFPEALNAFFFENFLDGLEGGEGFDGFAAFVKGSLFNSLPGL